MSQPFFNKELEVSTQNLSASLENKERSEESYKLSQHDGLFVAEENTDLTEEVSYPEIDTSNTTQTMPLLTQDAPASGDKRTNETNDNLEEQLYKKKTLPPKEIAQFWKRFIGSIQVSANATRPTVSKIPFGTKLGIVKKGVIKSNPARSILNRKRQCNTLVKLWDLKNDRELGRLPEKIARIILPFINGDEVTFDATMIFCNNKRLSIGDTIVVQLNCYLTSELFNNNGSLELSGKFTEDEQETKMQARRTSILTLFEELSLKAIENNAEVDNILKELEYKEKNRQQVECAKEVVIDLEDELNSSSQTVMDIENELNLNQLQAFYKIAQSADSLKTLPETEPAGNFKFSLKKYQKQGLSWMLKREREYSKIQSKDFVHQDSDKIDPLWRTFLWPTFPDLKINSGFTSKIFYANLYTGQFSMEKPILKLSVKGGILADEMGLGKTISTLSLVSTVPEDTEFGNKQSTGSNDNNSSFLFSNSQSIQSLTTSLPYAWRTTLIVVPMSLLSQWESEFRSCMDENTRCEIYYGDTVSNLKSRLINSKSPPTVLVTTYGVVQSEMLSCEMKPTYSGLFSVKFFRIVLDEGHNIRNKQTKTAKSIFKLKASRKWVLSGTPIINKLDDLYPIVKFLELNPWVNPGFWRRVISEPFASKDYKKALDVVFTILEPVLLRRTKNMRDSNGALLVNLPEKIVNIEKLSLTDVELAMYNSFLKLAEKSFRDALNKGILLKSYTSILVHILRLRQICCDMRLLLNKNFAKTESSKEEKSIQEDCDIIDKNPLKYDLEKMLELGFDDDINIFKEEEVNLINENVLNPKFLGKGTTGLECPICTTDSITPADKIRITECGHTFCFTCIADYIVHEKIKKMVPRCPTCRDQHLNEKRLFSVVLDKNGMIEAFSYYKNPKLSDFIISSKTNALCTHLSKISKESPKEHVVIFSQFSGFLEILKEILEVNYMVYKFDGSLSLKQRESILKHFNTDDYDGLKILLISLKAGGVGLNLTISNRAFIMDPWWSPSVEDQAIDRIHRMGQKRPVVVTRFIVEGSIEEKMLLIQERKRRLGDVVEGDEEERRKKRVDEIKMFFE
ncbi:related to DNA repair protein RAD5 [Saccharomycodes ludwigii]|uniref:DNA repair protein RAD5 n=1 Tax=Saccharomycodes ludwigii TaxID=36035 RepID=A0A376B2U0_9ASCO|nr:hypothetical protein SCDLUD_002420 [Saccharomycodes ludwigii]KAH3900958.1 hypothetical protein SCDLUD_002420 [Saccharomycodes ludwigii]SSD58995.1 related to DNA repair protein RAD5 [Saccharomycodes ludwigii]